MRIATLSLLAVLLSLALTAPAFASDLYNNGPTNGTSDAYYIDSFIVTDSFVAFGNMTAFTFSEWVPVGAMPATVSWAVGTTSYGALLGSGTATILPTNVAPLCSAGSSFNGGTCGGGFPYDVVNSTVVIPAIPLFGNTYWLTLTGATDTLGGHDAWDINSGPSLAFENLLGAVPSESFTIYDAPSQTTPEPGSIVLFGSGVLGLARLLRLRLKQV
ncbi:MAG: PEP-CTERM sorting domain-containing protein [Candidatus Korobacteraceae bacterium]